VGAAVAVVFVNDCGAVIAAVAVAEAEEQWMMTGI
jgi:hypothetical protein